MVKVYRYGLLPPTEGAERIADQMRLAHRYQNQLVEIERARRLAVRAVMGTHVDVETAAAIVAGHVAELARLRTEVQTTKAAGRTRKVPPALADQIGAVKIALTAARLEMKTAKHTATTDPVIVAALAQIHEDVAARLRAARAACGLYWGTYLLIEQAHDAARKAILDPHFRRWTGDGAVGVQLQGGLLVADAIDGTDTRLQIRTPLLPVPGRKGKPRPLVALRIGSTEGRDPIWGLWPLIYHRPLPSDGVIKWAKVVRRRVAAHDEWSLHVTVETETIDAPIASRTEVAVDLGWRQAEDTLRAGGWADDLTTTHDILVDRSAIGMIAKVEDLQSIRDKHMNAVRSQLLDWREQQELLPLEHAEQLKFLPQWKSPGRVAFVAIWWREHRIDGDAEILATLEAWRKQDKHLWLWEVHARRRALARRREQYRLLAAALATQYETLVIERLDLRSLAEIPPPESERDSHPKARSQRFETAPSELRGALVNAFRARGRTIVTVAPAGPATTLLAAYRERRDVSEIPVAARSNRFKELARKKEEKRGQRIESGEPLAADPASD